MRKREICKKQANFNQHKPKNKQPASLQKTRKSTKQHARIHGKTARLATLFETEYVNSIIALKCSAK